MRYVFALLICSQLAIGQKKLQYQDATYEESIRSVVLGPLTRAVKTNLLPAVAPIAAQDLVLTFDDIQESKNTYYARVIHCNANWQKSTLNDLDFLATFNEFNINDYEYSSNTHLPYIRYRFTLPTVKLPGNYLLIVYRDGDRSDVVLSMRFMIFQPMVSIVADNIHAGSLALSSTNQQINFLFDYRDLDVFNAMDNFNVVIRQNQRWDNARFEIKPSFIRDDLNQLEYRFFDQSNQWMAGNEFRFVDFRSLNSPGQNTAKINKTVKPFELSVRQDISRKDQAYAQYRDLNGGYQLDNLDYRDASYSEYLFVDFSLRSEQLADATIYVCGQFNNWARTEENKMTYDRKTSTYRTSIVLKQGWYDYTYLVDSPTLPATYFEGSHFQTENWYEIFVYYKSLKPMTDLLVGYYPVPINPR